MSKISSIKQDSFCAKLKTDFTSYITDKFYMLSLIITALGSYGFLITHYSISVDDLEWDRYYYGELIAQGRLTATVFHRLFNLTDNNIWIQDFWGLIFICIGTILLCIAFDNFLNGNSRFSKIVFSCLLISYPLHSELFSYNGCFLAVGLGITLIALALLLSIQYQNEKKIIYLVLAAVMILPAASWYESMLPIYVAAVFGILLLDQLSNKKSGLKKLFLQGIMYAVPLIVSVGFEVLLSGLVRKILNIEVSDNAFNSIGWFEKDTSLNGLSWFFGYMFQEISKAFINYFPITVFGIAVCIAFLFIAYDAIKNRRLGIVLCELGLIVSNLVITILTLNHLQYRTFTGFAFFVAFIFFMLLYRLSNAEKKFVILKSFAKIATCILCSVLIILQINSINYYFTNDYLRYDFEKGIMEDVGNELENNYDLSKNVIFVGEPEMSQNIKNRTEKDYNTIVYKALIHVPLINRYIRLIIPDSDVKVKIQQTNCQSYIKWSVEAFNQEPMIKFLRFIGFDNIKSGSEDEIEEAENNSEAMPSWPADGSIYDNGDYIIVKF